MVFCWLLVIVVCWPLFLVSLLLVVGSLLLAFFNCYMYCVLFVGGRSLFLFVVLFVCWWLIVVRCLSCVVCCGLHLGCCRLVVFVDCCMLFCLFVCGLLLVGCVLFVACCLLFVVCDCCSLFVGCCILLLFSLIVCLLGVW